MFRFKRVDLDTLGNWTAHSQTNVPSTNVVTGPDDRGRPDHGIFQGLRSPAGEF